MTRHRLALVTLGAILASMLAAATSHGQGAAWFSEPKSPDQLSEDLKGLYESLYAAGTLPKQSYVDRDGLPLEKILYQERQFFGPSFPLEVQKILCEWNRKVCKRSRDAAGRVTYMWSNGIGAELIIPKLEFTMYTAPQVYTKKRTESLESLVVERAKGCLELSEECRRRIQNLNRLKENVLDPAYEGPVVVPALALRLVLPATPAPPTESAAKPRVPKSLQKIQQNVVLPTWQQKLQGAGDDKFKASSGRVHERIGLSSTMPRPAARTLALFDAPVDKSHCYFETARIRVMGPPMAPPEDPECGGEDTNPKLSAHGTHMVGLMVAQRNGSAFGINPRVSIVAYTVSTDGPNFLKNLADAMSDAVELEGADIGNLSLGVPTPDGGNPAFNRLKIPNDRLWVAAAGNAQAQTGTSGCGWFPACAGLLLPNVISVVAVNLDVVPMLFSGSNSGESFDLAAPGEGVISTIPGGRLGPMSGTSQATAIVSAIASMLIGRDKTLPPREVRARLIYTTDLYASLENRVLGGRVNTSRALALEHDVVRLNDGRELRGIIRRSGDSVRYTRRPGGARDEATMTQLKRIATDDRGERVIFRDQGGLRPVRVGIATIDAAARWTLDLAGGGSETVDVAAVTDFTACHLVTAPTGGPECWRGE
jgi:hypothetical protein